jgi:hypothetical protein
MSNTRKAGTVVTGTRLKARRDGRIVECPSGNCYRLRSIANEEFTGLLGGFVDLGRAGATAEELENAADRAAMNAQAMLQQGEALVGAALIEPKIGDGEDEISIKDIPYGDLQHLVADITQDLGLAAAGARYRPTSAAAN